MTDISNQIDKIEKEIKFKLSKETKIAMYTFSAISILLAFLAGVAATAKRADISFYLFLAICDIWISILILFLFDKLKFVAGKKTLKKTIKYDLQQLAKMLNYPSDDLSKEPDIDDELCAFYALRDRSGEFQKPEEAWKLTDNVANGDADKFSKLMVAIEDFVNSEILLHENGLEWTVKTKGQTKLSRSGFTENGVFYKASESTDANYTLTEIDESKCRVFNGGISDFLTKRWGPFLRINIDSLGPDYNPFIRIVKKSEKPVRFMDLWWCWKIINEF
jgi:hypothetical protein